MDVEGYLKELRQKARELGEQWQKDIEQAKEALEELKGWAANLADAPVASGDSVLVPRDFLVEVDANASMVAYRWGAGIPDDVVKDLKRISATARRLSWRPYHG